MKSSGHRFIMAGILLVLLCQAKPTWAADKTYSLNSDVIKHSLVYPIGILELYPRTSWKFSRSEPTAAVPSVAYTTQDDTVIRIRVMTGGRGVGDEEALRSRVLENGMRLLGQAVETDLEILDITGKNAKGYYYILTDKAPKPGEWKYIMEGMYQVNEVVLIITIVSHEKTSEDMADALAMIQHAVFTGKP